MNRTRIEVFEPASPPYSNLTVRRAFIVWLHCGQINKFKDVCNYYHVLEKMEERLPPEKRTRSRRHELNLFTNHPPSSIYLNYNHPFLYDKSELNDTYTNKVEAIRNDKCVFKLDGFRKFCKKEGVTRLQIIDTSKLIRDHCQGRNITLDQFLIEYERYAKRCKLCDTMTNLWGYLRKQLIKDEITMVSNWPVTFSFLEDDEVPHTFINSDDKNSDAKASTGTKVPVDLNNQKKLLHSIHVLPNMLNELKCNPWRTDKRIC